MKVKPLGGKALKPLALKHVNKGSNKKTSQFFASTRAVK